MLTQSFIGNWVTIYLRYQLAITRQIFIDAAQREWSVLVFALVLSSYSLRSFIFQPMIYVRLSELNFWEFQIFKAEKTRLLIRWCSVSPALWIQRILYCIGSENYTTCPSFSLCLQPLSQLAQKYCPELNFLQLVFIERTWSRGENRCTTNLCSTSASCMLHQGHQKRIVVNDSSEQRSNLAFEHHAQRWVSSQGIEW